MASAAVNQPLSARNRGKAKLFYEQICLTFEGDECLIWPFFRSPDGYAILNNRLGLSRVVSRRLCTDAHGQPPTAKHEAAHSCGHGSKGCVNKRHLAWKTKTENQLDRVLHGTTCHGVKSGRTNLNDDDVRNIRALAGTISQKEIARLYGVSKGRITHIATFRTWGHLS